MLLSMKISLVNDTEGVNAMEKNAKSTGQTFTGQPISPDNQSQDKITVIPNDMYINEVMKTGEGPKNGKISNRNARISPDGQRLILYSDNTESGEGAVLCDLPKWKDFSIPAKQALIELIALGVMDGWRSHAFSVNTQTHLALLGIDAYSDKAEDELKRIRIALQELNDWRLPMLLKDDTGKLRKINIGRIGEFGFSKHAKAFAGSFSLEYYEYLKLRSSNLIYCPPSLLALRGRNTSRGFRMLYNISMHKSMNPIYENEPLVDIIGTRSMLLAASDIATVEEERKKDRKQSSPTRHIIKPFFDGIKTYINPIADTVFYEEGSSEAYTAEEISKKVTANELWQEGLIKMFLVWRKHPHSDGKYINGCPDEDGTPKTRPFAKTMTEQLLNNIRSAIERARGKTKNN